MPLLMRICVTCGWCMFLLRLRVGTPITSVLLLLLLLKGQEDVVEAEGLEIVIQSNQFRPRTFPQRIFV